eukprot:TRINITY_DN6741_c0_g1_i1.p1 TRINITY_DN6741_c0_g1~~TRINITY_DN6741_c0_g1_i1.p1  ORF type:complete len:1103 (+),score=213.98 TRINITY_DN6741_c0_g1_i1:50-3358(+)
MKTSPQLPPIADGTDATLTPKPPPFSKRPKDKTLGFLLGNGDISHRGDRTAAKDRSGVERHDEKEIVRKLISEGVGEDTFLGSVVRLFNTHNETGPPVMVPKEYWVYSESPLVQSFDNSCGASEFDQEKRLWRKKIFPSEKPTSRMEVILLAKMLDTMLSHIDVSVITDSERCYSADNSDYNETFKELLQVYNVGFSEVIRQVYTSCAERGVVLDRIRGLFMDFSYNCFDILSFLKSQIRVYDSKTKVAEEAFDKAKGEAITTRYELVKCNNDLSASKAEIEDLKTKIKNQNALEKRDVLVRNFMSHQAERNNMILHMSLSATQGELGGNNFQDDEDYEVLSDDFEDIAESPNTRCVLEGVDTFVPKRSFRRKSVRKGSRFQAQNPQPLPSVQASTTSTQTDDDVWDEPLYDSLRDFCNLIRKVVHSTEEVTPLYANLIYNNPLESAKWANSKMKNLVKTYMTGQDEPSAEEVIGGLSQEQIKQHKGSFVITKKLLTETLGDINSTLKEITTRLSSFAVSMNFKNHMRLMTKDTAKISKTLTTEDAKVNPVHTEPPQLQPPGAGDVCPLCMRIPPEKSQPRNQSSPLNQRRSTFKAAPAFGAETPPAQPIAPQPLPPVEIQEPTPVEDVLLVSSLHTQQSFDKPTKTTKQTSDEEWVRKMKKTEKEAADKAREHDAKVKQLENKLNEQQAIMNKQLEDLKQLQAAKLPTTPLKQTAQPLASTPHDTKGIAVSQQKVEQEPAKPPMFVKTELALAEPVCSSPVAEAEVESDISQRTDDKDILSPIPQKSLKHITKVESMSSIGQTSAEDDEETEELLERTSPIVLNTREFNNTLESEGKGRKGTLGGDTTRRLAKKLTPEEKKAEVMAQRERRRKELLYAKSEHLANIAAGTYQPKTLIWLLKQITAFYKAKIVADMKIPGSTEVPLAEFVIDKMRQRHGSKKLSDDQIGILLATANRNKSDPRVALFSRLLSGVYSTTVLSLVLRYSKAVDDAKVGPEYARSADESVKPSNVSLVRCLFALGQLEQDERLVEAITKETREASQPMDAQAFKSGMLKTGYTTSDIPKIEKQWQCDEATARNSVRKIDFLTIVAENVTDTEESA